MICAATVMTVAMFNAYDRKNMILKNLGWGMPAVERRRMVRRLCESVAKCGRGGMAGGGAGIWHCA